MTFEFDSRSWDYGIVALSFDFVAVFKFTKDNYTKYLRKKFIMYGYNNQQYGYQTPYQNNQYGYQNNYQQPPQPQQIHQEVLYGKYVDSIDVVKASNVDMSGNITWYPKSDKSEVYCKGLNPNTGSSYILTYKLVQTETPQQNKQSTIDDTLNSLKDEILELKNLVLESITAPSKGGDKK